MSAETPLAVRSWRVGKRTVTLTVQRMIHGAVGNAVAEWSPSQPKRLTSKERREYRAGRDNALAEIAGELGGFAAVLEL